MLDAELQIVDSYVVDISSATSFTTTAVQLNRRGFPKNATFVIHLEDTSTDDSIDPWRVELEVSVDGGTVWHRVAAIDFNGNSSAEHGGPFSVPIGMMDFRAEQRSTTEIQVRTRVTLAATGGADDITFSAYIGSGNEYHHFLASATPGE